MADELKPCPMCGNVEIAVGHVRAGVEWWAADCEAERGDGCGLSITRGTRAAAIAAWNTRPSTPPAVSEDQVEALEAVKRACNLAMRHTIDARIPECGHFGAIAQDLYAALAVLPGIIHRPEPVAAEPVAWLYEHPMHPSEVEAGVSARLTEHDKSYGWTETPLYTHPPAPKQAQPIDEDALVERMARTLAKIQWGEEHSWECFRDEARAILPIIREHLK